MHIDERSLIEFNRYHLVVRNLLDAGFMDEQSIFYYHVPLIRQAVRKMTTLMAADYLSLFTPDASDGREESNANQSPDGGRGHDLGQRVAMMEYFVLQHDQLTLVAAEQRFFRGPIMNPVLKSLKSHVMMLLASHSPEKNLPGTDEPGPSMEPFVSSGETGGTAVGSAAFPFKCRRCGKCCRSLAVIVTPEDMDRMAASIEIPLAELKTKYLEPEPFTWSDHEALVRKSPSLGKGRRKGSPRCIFLKEEALDLHSCEIYETRPEACRRYIPTMGHCG
jgi:Fe-S-cluster containining protein